MTKKVSAMLGLISGLLSICLWISLSFFNPYSNAVDIEPIINTFIMLFLPACLAITSSIMSKKLLMLIAFLWALPISLYMAMTPGIFALFGVTCFAYLLSYLLMLVRVR
ncbi:hypothetical protein P9E76_00080 [Schinkia azotoformans]|uniref:hypothetical protein n=1 Tax=Schinkia azotoformans TaxID=1454 RepID=UPI000587D314|nr:hypothetical protein [Schinkia azotoformans]MEC1640045.1 hypothetical protein [Schinkia azotoformans]MEC1722638.1 hypothetical protein [Schinkia azotoformans]MEC1943483.1 hypothetical protein [Schinkia azotoformans]MED4415407.1 hypothetical protein [Schinkia azotoformans]